MTRLAKIPLWGNSNHYKSLLIIMMVAAFWIAMASTVSQASSPVPLNTPGIYSATADDGGTIYLYRYAPHTNKTPEFRTRGTPVVIFTCIMVNMNQFLSCTPAEMK